MLLLAAPLAAALFFGIRWRDDLPLVAAYLGAWAAHSLYSIAPFRLKNRGGLGLIADACGSHVFPALTASLLAGRATGSLLPPVWIDAVVVWSFGYGLRGILWHELYDVEADRKAAVQTFAVRHSPALAARLALAALLVELAGLAALLWQSGSFWAVAFLLIYATYAILKSRIWNLAIVIAIAEPRDCYSILGQEYYTLLLPLGLLLSSALRHPADWAVIAAHLIVFARPAVKFAGELAQLSIDIADRPGKEIVAQHSRD
jgi:hypothetical protein